MKQEELRTWLRDMLAKGESKAEIMSFVGIMSQWDPASRAAVSHEIDTILDERLLLSWARNCRSQHSPEFLHQQARIERGEQLEDAALAFLRRVRRTDAKRVGWTEQAHRVAA